MSTFAHLHVHTEYSILDGLAKIPQLIEKAYNDGQRAMAITDHGNMYGVYEFVDIVEKFNKEKAIKDDPFKAIIGCEVYVAQNSLHDKKTKEDRGGRHLILLAKNWVGYRNLSKLLSIAFIDGFYYVARIDKEILKQYSEGIIACSACLGGELAKSITNFNEFTPDGSLPNQLNLDAARKIVQEFKEIFGRDYYLEMQLNGHKEQLIVNKAIAQLSQEYDVPYIATNDVHYVNQDDFDAHRLLICINTHKDYYTQDSATQDADTDIGLAYTGQEFMRTTQEMVELFAEYPMAVTNTQRVADKIEVLKLKTQTLLPKFSVPAGFKDEYDYMEHLVYEGAKKRWPEITPEIQERITFELSTVKKMGFPGYFLIVWDFINAGKQNGVRFGPGRGSAAGSILAYCMGITHVDPIRYNLLFERFLNPDRISLPDMDIDMDDTGREKVIQYVIGKYGKERVAQIVTFNTMAAKSAIRDCGRVLQLPLAESDRLAKFVPEGPGVTLEKSYKEIPELKAALTSPDEKVKKTLEFALKLEGTIRSAGVHACGVIIGKENLFDLIPLSASKNSETPVTQYEGKYVESAGLLKMDFLGLKTLNILGSAIELIKKRFGIDLDLDNLPLDDKETYDLLGRGDTTGVFQLESPGMRKYLIDLKPERFEDIIAMVSLYRPGPMASIPSFINRKLGVEAITYRIDEMRTYLDDTYGITIYQEQVMLLSRLLAGFTPGQADTLRKAMGKKQVKVMEELQKDFLINGEKLGHDTAVLTKIWEEWREFAKYAFNKSHATCYALVAYQTAYLKTHYFSEFMAANLTNNLNNMVNIKKFIEDIQRTDVKIINPNINASFVDFSTDKEGNVLFGLAALSGVGATAIHALVKEREENGKYTDIFDFITRIDSKACTRKSIEALVYAGAFDCFPEIHRAQFFKIGADGKSTFLEKLISWGNRTYNDAPTIFDQIPELQKQATPEVPDADRWNYLEQLKHEKEVAGFYISGHPLNPFSIIEEEFCNINFETIKTADLKDFIAHPMSFMAIVLKAQKNYTKNGKEYCRLTLEDRQGTYEWSLFGTDYLKFAYLFQEGQRLFIKAIAKKRFNSDPQEPDKYELKPADIFLLDESYDKLCSQVILSLNIQDLSSHVAMSIKESIKKSKGKTPLSIRISEHNQNFFSDFSNSQLKVNPESFVKNLSLHISHKIKLKDDKKV